MRSPDDAYEAICEGVVEVEGVDIEFASDVLDAVGAQDVDRKAAEAGEVQGLDAGPALVFAECDVANIMAPIFHCPVVSDRLAEGFGVEFDLAGVERNVLGGIPEAGSGVLVPGPARDPGGLDGQAVPLGIEFVLNVEGLDQAGFMTAVAPGIDALEALDRRLLGGDLLERGQQARLVGLDLGEQRVAAVAGRLKGFSGSAGRRR